MIGRKWESRSDTSTSWGDVECGKWGWNKDASGVMAAGDRRGVGLVREVAVDVEPQELGKMSRRS